MITIVEKFCTELVMGGGVGWGGEGKSDYKVCFRSKKRKTQETSLVTQS